MLNEKIYVFDDIIDVNRQNDIIKLLIKDYDLDGKYPCLLYTSPSPRDRYGSRMPSSA